MAQFWPQDFNDFYLKVVLHDSSDTLIVFGIYSRWIKEST